MSKKNELKDYILFFKRLSAERSLIADCKVGKIDCGVTSSQFNKKMPPLPKNHCLKQ